MNIYGDRLVRASEGHGADIASQRADDLDLMAVETVRETCAQGVTPHALDAACGLGGQAVRLAQAGARVIAADIADLGGEVAVAAAEGGCSERLSFVKADLRQIDEELAGWQFDLICCQRAIHYLPWNEAVEAVRRLTSLLKPEGRLYLSASGLKSELGEGYGGREHPVSCRYAPLAEAMAAKHGIAGPVCLYSMDDLAALFGAAELSTDCLFVSPFGNVKGVARWDKGKENG